MKKKKRKKEPWLVIIYEDDNTTTLRAAIDDNPFDIAPKWSTPDGVLIHAALSFFAKMLVEDKNGARWHMAQAAEAFGVPAGQRMPDEEQMTRVISQVFRILTKNNRRKVCVAMHDLIFWKGFRGGFIHATHSPVYTGKD